MCSFESAVSQGHTSPLNAVKPAGVALTSDAAQVAGLGRILFLDFFGHGFSRIRTDQADPVDHVDAHTYT